MNAKHSFAVIPSASAGRELVFVQADEVCFNEAGFVYFYVEDQIVAIFYQPISVLLK